MSGVPSKANTVFRDYEIDGFPSSGEYMPPKVDIRDLFNTIGTELDALETLIGSVSSDVTAQLEIALDSIETIRQAAEAAQTAAEAALASVQALVDDAAIGYLSFETTAEMTAYTTAEDNQTAYDAETDSYYRWDDVGNVWEFVRTAENTRITELESRVLPQLIDANHTVTGSNEVLDVDTTGGEIEITLDASPSDMDRVVVNDIKGSFSIHNCVIIGNGKTIGGSATSIRCREPIPMNITIIFDSSEDTWLLLN